MIDKERSEYEEILGHFFKMNPVVQEVMTEPIYGDKSITIFFDSSKRTKIFTKAAEQLHITQPTLFRQLAAFEEELGISLFVRKWEKYHAYR